MIAPIAGDTPHSLAETQLSHPDMQRTALQDWNTGQHLGAVSQPPKRRLLSPLVAGSLERAANLAEAMEARGFGSTRPSKAPGPAWRLADRLALAASAFLILVAALWL